MKAMILAAGLGKRLRPLTLTTPKPLLSVHGKPLIVYHIENLARAGFTEIIINHAWLGEQIESALGDGKQWGVRITYSAEGEPLETAGGIVLVLDQLSDKGEAFLVVNGDIITDFDFSSLSEVNPGVAHLVLVPNPSHHPDGDFTLLAEGALALQTTKQTFAGISVLTRSLFDPLLNQGGDSGPLALGPLLKEAVAAGQVSGTLHEGFWIDVGTCERLQQAEIYLQEKMKDGI
jgi:MurNAc alpha-1-phosphate uridylyltransferase